jgi:hypothetical protein
LLLAGAPGQSAGADIGFDTLRLAPPTRHEVIERARHKLDATVIGFDLCDQSNHRHGEACRHEAGGK